MTLYLRRNTFYSKRLFSTIETWKEIPGFPNYHVSTLGNVKNIVSNRLRNIDLDYYRKRNMPPRMKLTHGTKYKTYILSKLVLSTFKPTNANLNAVHVDGNKFNNALNNLEWMTPSQTSRHAIKLGLVDFEQRTVSVTIKKVDSRSEDVFGSVSMCAKHLQSTGIDVELGKLCSCISLCCSNKTSRYGYYLLDLQMELLRDMGYAVL